MKGGTISGNRTAGKSYGLGGGVEVHGGGGTFTMESGAISGNTATADDRSGGGGVNIDGDEVVFTMKGGTISGNRAIGEKNGEGGGVNVNNGATFIMKDGTIYGKTGKLPNGVNESLANSAEKGDTATLYVEDPATAKWGTGGTYTKGNVDQTGGNDIESTDETLIAIPAGV
jgi:hypothetical protein